MRKMTIVQIFLGAEMKKFELKSTNVKSHVVTASFCIPGIS